MNKINSNNKETALAKEKQKTDDRKSLWELVNAL